MDLQISKQAKLPSKHGNFIVQAFKEGCFEHLVVKTPDIPEVPYVRIHSECLTGDVFKSVKCDCGFQMDKALKAIKDKGGMIIYLRQEGRGIGLVNKINAYALQDEGFDTVEANQKLGFKEDERDYKIVDKILEHYDIKKINLLSNNPRKINGLKKVEVVQRTPIEIESCETNKGYLSVKKDKLGHLLSS